MTALDEFRAAKDAYYGSSHDSPLLAEQRASFHGLNYYPENPALAVAVQPDVFDEPELVELQTSTGEQASYLRWGTITFEAEGTPATLTLFRASSEDGFFLPFQDAGRGVETYGAGRYVEPELLPDGRVAVDFNYAYNPYCAYNDAWSCPLPPPENRLNVHLRAGEKVFHSEE